LDENNYIKKFNELFERQLDKQNDKIDIYSKKKIFDYFKYRGWENDMVFNKMNTLK
jgi:regulatory protein